MNQTNETNQQQKQFDKSYTRIISTTIANTKKV